MTRMITAKWIASFWQSAPIMRGKGGGRGKGGVKGGEIDRRVQGEDGGGGEEAAAAGGG